jgi:malonate transporter
MNALINVVLPVFGIIVTGYLAGRFGVLGPDSAAALNRFVFYFALPPALFIFVARAPVDKIFNWPFIGAFVSGGLLTILIALIVGRLWLQQAVATLTVSGLTAGWGNTVYMGLPLLLTAYGQDAVVPTIITALSQLVLFLTIAIAVLEGTRTSGSSAFRVASQLVGSLLRNPLVVSPLLGILFSLSAVPLPKAVSNYLDLMAAAVGPAALFALGLSLVGRKLIGNAAEAIWLASLKVVVNPILTIMLVAYLFALDPLWSKAAIILSAMPVGANPYVIAQQYDLHVETVSSAIIISTAMSVATVFFLLVWLGPS